LLALLALWRFEIQVVLFADELRGAGLIAMVDDVCLASFDNAAKALWMPFLTQLINHFLGIRQNFLSRSEDQASISVPSFVTPPTGEIAAESMSTWVIRTLRQPRHCG